MKFFHINLNNKVFDDTITYCIMICDSIVTTFCDSVLIIIFLPVFIRCYIWRVF